MYLYLYLCIYIFIGLLIYYVILNAESMMETNPKIESPFICIYIYIYIYIYIHKQMFIYLFVHSFEELLWREHPEFIAWCEYSQDVISSSS